MSFLSTAIQRHSERRRYTQTDLSRLCGISPSYISRFYAGLGEMSDENFLAILKLFATEPVTQAEFIAARCMDVRVGPSSELVEIKVRKPQPATGDAPAPVGSTVELAQETERAFAWLRAQCPINPEMEKHLIGYARLLGMK